MDPIKTVDPYFPPASDVNRGLDAEAREKELAEPGTRMVAHIVDGLLVSIPLAPGIALAMREAVRIQRVANAMGIQGNPPGLPNIDPQSFRLATIALSLGALITLGITIYQWILISGTGQSLGKKWNGIRIERVDGLAVGFVSCVVLRNWLLKLLGAVPYIGIVFYLVDSLCIFRRDRRCLHDHLAGTRVVRER
jgi:uncharacterized RDD family membrane protein YckC